MLEKFKSELAKFSIDLKNVRFLIASSGGLDSTLLIHLCNALSLDFGICHCNFKLRGKASDEDETFLRELAENFCVPIYVLSKNAKVYAKQHKLSTQEAARQIRYEWFKNCLENEGYDMLMTAHHADDNLETFLINAFRGTGIKGLTGVPAKRGNILRPLLKFSRDQIYNYAIANNLSWREDQSNESDAYLRNVLRHHLIPFFKNRNDNHSARFNNTLGQMSRQHTLLKDYMALVKEKVILQKQLTLQISLSELKSFSNPQFILIELLKDYGFSDFRSLQNLLNAQNGKYVTSGTHKAVKEREFLEVFSLIESNSAEIEIEISSIPNRIVFENGELHFSNQNDFNITPQHTAFLNKDLITEDLVLRPMRIGDFFYPLGMAGKRKLSDFLKDEKLTNFEKSKVWVLTHKNDIVWVVNHRIDNRYKIIKSTKVCLKIEFVSS